MNRKLTELMDKLEYEQVCGKKEREITAVVYDSRKVIPGCLFICINGANFDGHDLPHRWLHRAPGCWWYKRT